MKLDGKLAIVTGAAAGIGQVPTIDGGYVMDGSLPGAKCWTE